MLDPEREKKLEELFQLALEIRRSEREAFFRRHCGDDEDLRRELQSLLRQDDEGTKDFLTSPVVSRAADGTTLSPSSEFAGTSASLPERVGHYRLMHKLGEGGMGSVFLAEQEYPVKREVALKVVKLGMDTEKVIARFERERQTLALMDHPSIAQIYDGGTTDGGRPYFVMEYVPGLPIHEFCDQNGLGVSERLKLFMRVCDAVQHAHHKGIIHRDIKPSNVLVVSLDGEALPKIIDFGIARAISDSAEERLAHTQEREVVGTCYYMSPEQADTGNMDIDTRTDVYSLGVLLYELLAGVLPFDTETLQDMTPAEVHTVLREIDPPPPSTRISKLGKRSTSLAKLRRTDRRSLIRHLSGDLDWITIKALEKEPERRYATVSEFAADVGRYLNHEPVLAGPPDFVYRTRKFVKRYRVAVFSGTLIAAALLLATGATTWGMFEARRNEKKANRAEVQADRERAEAQQARATADDLRAVAEEEARQARRLTRFLAETVSLADPEVALDADVSLSTMLRHAGLRVGRSFEGFPEGEAVLRRAIGQAFHSLGELELAELHLKRTLEIQEGIETTPREELYRTMQRLSEVYRDSDSRDGLDLGIGACYVAIDWVAESDPDLAEELEALVDAVLYMPEEALGRFLELRELLDGSLGPEDPMRLVFADVEEFLGEFLGTFWGDASALPFLEAALEVRRGMLDPTHPEIAKTVASVVELLNQQGEHVRAEGLAREAIEIYSSSLSDDHWLIAEARSMLGECLSAQGRAHEAENLLLEGYRGVIEARGDTSRSTIEATFRLFRHYQRTEDGAGEERYRVLLARGMAFSKNPPHRWDRREAVFGTDNQELVAALRRLDELLFGPESQTESVETSREVRRLLDDIRRMRRENLAGEEALSIIVARALSGAAEGPVSSVFEEEMCLEVLKILEGHEDRLPRPLAQAWESLGRIALENERDSYAERCYRAARDHWRRAYGPLSMQALQCEGTLAGMLGAWNRKGEIDSELVRSWEDCLEALGENHSLTFEALSNVVGFYHEWDDPRRSARLLAVHLERASEMTNPERLNALAWFVARETVFEEELYKQALAAAERSLRRAPKVATYANTFAVATFRLGRYEETLEALENSMELSNRDDPIDWAVMAMTLHALGRNSEARRAVESFESLLEDPLNRGDPETQVFEIELRERIASDP